MLFFFFKHKTAYEMRISDWSSDVCSSDLAGLSPGRAEGRGHAAAGARAHRDAAGRGGSADGAPRRRRVSVRRPALPDQRQCRRSEEHTSELQSLMRISYAVFCLKKKTKHVNRHRNKATLKR